jgi:ABC-2 type transport system permease protein
MMLFHLVKKDFLLIKKFIFIMMLIFLGIPVFTVWTVPSLSGFYPFLHMVVLGEIILLQAVSQTEAKYPKAAALLCAAPYSRNTFVIAKYVFSLLIFAYCYVAYTFIMLAINREMMLDLSMVLVVLLFAVTLCGIYLPVELRYGLVKAKFIFMVLVLIFSLGPTLLSDVLSNITLDFSVLAKIPANLRNIILALVNIMVFCVSMVISLKIYKRKDL